MLFESCLNVVTSFSLLINKPACVFSRIPCAVIGNVSSFLLKEAMFIFGFHQTFQI